MLDIRLRHGQAVWLMLLVTMMWSIAGVVTRHLEFARSFEITFWRSFFTMVSLAVLLPLFQGAAVWRKFATRSVSFWVSGVCWCVMFTAFMVALTLTAVANVLVTLALGPLMTAIVARIFIGHRIALRTGAAIAAAGGGIAWMYAGQVGGGQWAGTLVALCVPLAGAINWTVTQRAHARGVDVDLVPAVMVGAVLSCLLTLPLAFPLRASAHDIGLLAVLGLFQLAIPCVLSVICARVLKAPEVSLLALLEVIFGIFLVWLGAGEAPEARVLIGGTVVISALVINELLAWRERS
jgi:drug/metabolite transporter (DMT)-like permease